MANEPHSGDERATNIRVLEVFEMSPMLLAFLGAATPLAGLGLLQLQARLERWDYERHAED